MSSSRPDREVRQATRGQRPLLRREAATLRALRSLHVAVGVVGLEEDDELTVLVTTGGPSIRAAVRRRPERFVQLAAAFADTVRRLHDAGWAHGSITAETCVVAGRNRVLLRDLSSAVHGPGVREIDDDLRAATGVLREMAVSARAHRSQRRAAHALIRAIDRTGTPRSAAGLTRLVEQACGGRRRRRATASPPRFRVRPRASDRARRSAVAGLGVVATAAGAAVLVLTETHDDALADAGRWSGLAVLALAAIRCTGELVRSMTRRTPRRARRTTGRWTRLRPLIGLGGLSALVAIVGGSTAVASPTGGVGNGPREGAPGTGPDIDTGIDTHRHRPAGTADPVPAPRTYLPWAPTAPESTPADDLAVTTTATPATVAPTTTPVPPQEPRSPTAEREHVVERGEHLWGIAEAELEHRLGRAPTDAEIAPYWRFVVAVNRDRLADPEEPDLIFSGQSILLP
jgi:tRNA A-37 threonylcarbamoyl transferase component Bud32